MTDPVAVETLRDELHGLHGGQLLAARDHLPDDPSEAVHARGKAEAFRTVLLLLDHLEDHGDPPREVDEDLWQAYVELSQAAIAADRVEIETEPSSGGPTVGVQ